MFSPQRHDGGKGRNDIKTTHRETTTAAAPSTRQWTVNTSAVTV